MSSSEMNCLDRMLTIDREYVSRKIVSWAIGFAAGCVSGIVDFKHRCMFQSHGLECRAEVFRGIVRQEVAYFDEAETGVLTSRLGSDCHAVARAAATNINVALRNSLQCIGESLTSNCFPCKSVQMSAFRVEL